MSKLHHVSLALGLFASAIAIPTLAQTTANIPPGRLLASNCFQCHSVTGNNSGFESLRGESASEIYEELLEYRSGQEGEGLMKKHALGYTDLQLRQIADYLATIR